MEPLHLKYGDHPWATKNEIDAYRKRIFRVVTDTSFTELAPQWNRGQRTPVILRLLAVVTFIVASVGLYFFSSLQVLDHLDHFAIAFHISSLFSLALCNFVTFNSNWREYEILFKFLATEDLVRYNSETLERLKPTLIEGMNRETSIFYVVYFLPVLFVPLLGIWAVITDFFLNNSTPYVNGVNVKLFVPMFLPFSSHSGIAYYICSLYTCFNFVVSIKICFPAIYTYFLFFERIILELNILRHSLVLFEERVANQVRLTENRLKASDKKATMEAAVVCLKQNFFHFQKIRRHFKLFSKVWKNVLFTYIISGVVFVALAMTTMKSSTVGLRSFMIMLWMGAVEILSLFFLCWYGQKVVTACDILNNEFYFIHWYEYGVRFKKYFSVFKGLITDSLKIHAGPILCNANTFVTMVNRGYSYFNLMNAADK